MKSMIVVTDIHGCFDTLMALKEQFPEDVPWCIAGDLVDRGPRNRQVIDYVRKNKIPCVKGNHEILMYDNDMEMRQCWLMNGGSQTQNEYLTVPATAEYKALYHLNPPQMMMDAAAFEADKQWLRTLPLYLEYPEIVREDGRHLLVTHTTFADIYHMKDTIPHMKAVWQRKGIPKSIPGVFNVYGHTPVEKPIIKEHFANIDTGCVANGRWGLKYLTALQFPEMIIYQQECIDFDLPSKKPKNKRLNSKDCSVPNAFTQTDLDF